MIADNHRLGSIVLVIKRYLVEHGPDSGYQLIEPVDGFHPNQVIIIIITLVDLMQKLNDGSILCIFIKSCYKRPSFR